MQRCLAIKFTILVKYTIYYVPQYNNYKFVNNKKSHTQLQLVSNVCDYNLSILRALTKQKLGTQV